jgi:hypothetical protein
VVSVILCGVQQEIGCTWLCLVTRHTVSQPLGPWAIKLAHCMERL